ncbi:hypothetical protein FM113_17020 [Leucobacter sp. 7(1)]|nr:hypothetical protein FM113_17020 [Leucobacter sp. 7(1)]
MAVLLGVIICAAFVTFWVRAGAIVASGPEGAGPGAEHPLLGVPGLVGLILGCATGVTLITLGLWRILRKLSRRGSGNAPHAHIPALHRARPVFGSAATHLMLGVVGVGPGSLARLLAAILPWVLVTALTLSTEPRIMFAAPFLAFLGALLGRALYAARPGARWARPLIVAGIPLLLAIPPLLSSLRPGTWTIPLAFLVGAEIGAHIGELRERSTSPSARVLAWEYAGLTEAGVPGGFRWDPRPLVRRPSRGEQRSLVRAHPELHRTEEVVRVRTISAVAAVFPIGVIAMGYGMVQQALSGEADTPRQLLGMSAVLSLMLLGGGVLLWWSNRARARLTGVGEHLVFAEFARQNDLVYAPKPRLSADGTELLTLTMRAVDSATELTIANREAQGSSALSSSRTQFGGVCELTVSTPLPHILLRSNAPMLPALSAYTAPDRSQRLELEGDFDRYFRMYVPKGYERDALYLFTPDVMAWLVDDVQGYDVELRDRQLTLRSRRDMVTRDPADWAQLAHALDTVGQRIAQWERWRDARFVAGGSGSRLAYPERGVAPGGQRLRLGIGAGTVFAVLFGACYLTLTLIAQQL